MSSKGKAAPRYTDEEDDIIRKIWASKKTIKAQMDLLPRRTVGSVSTRACFLGLGKRKTRLRGTPCIPVTVFVQRALARGPMTNAQLVKHTGFCLSPICEWTKKRHAAGELHIARWVCGNGRGSRFVAVYALGKGIDAVRPEPLGERRVRRRPSTASLFASLTMRPVVGFDIPFGTLERAA